MASAKRTSVAGTQFSKDTAYSASAVYSLTGGDAVGDGALRMAYNSCSSLGAQEGITRVSTTGRGVAASADGGNVTAVDGVTQADNTIGLPASTATNVICGTRTLTGNGAGLIVEFDTTNAATAQNHASAYTVVDAGIGYADNDTVEIVGFPGSVLTVNGVG